MRCIGNVGTSERWTESATDSMELDACATRGRLRYLNTEFVDLAWAQPEVQGLVHQARPRSTTHATGVHQRHTFFLDGHTARQRFCAHIPPSSQFPHKRILNPMSFLYTGWQTAQHCVLCVDHSGRFATTGSDGGEGALSERGHCLAHIQWQKIPKWRYIK